MAKITVQETEVTILSVQDKDYISLTDMANAKESESRAADIIKNRLRNRYTLEFLGTWEMIHNQDLKVVEFDHFKSQAGLPSFRGTSMPQSQRLILFNQIAIRQMKVLQEAETRKFFKTGGK